MMASIYRGGACIFRGVHTKDQFKRAPKGRAVRGYGGMPPPPSKEIFVNRDSEMPFPAISWGQFYNSQHGPHMLSLACEIEDLKP